MLRLPLTPDQFRHAIYAGLGRAVMHVRAHGGEGLKEIIYDACIKHRAYDPQLERPRGGWLLHILDLSGHEQALRPKIIAAVLGAEDTWDADQLSRLAAGFARRGDVAARQALYAAFESGAHREWWVGGRQIIELDGPEGLLRVARVVGRRLRSDPAAWISGEILDVAAAISGRDAVVETLLAAAPIDPDIGAFCAVLMDEESPRRDASIPSLTKWQRLMKASPAERDAEFAADRERRNAAMRAVGFETIRHKLDDPATPRFPPRGWFVSWGLAVPDEQTVAAADSLAQETDEAKLKCLLAIFCHRELPSFHQRVLDLVADPEHSIGHAAAMALSRTTHHAVREAAVSGLRSRPLQDRTLLLLRANYREGDAALLEQAISDTGDMHATHWVVHELVQLYEHNKLPESLGPLLWAYEASTCSNCRYGAVALMVELGMAPEWLREECVFDADPGVRESVGGRRDEFGPEDN